MSPGRNEPCPCGSGKKYKKCCGAGAGRADPDDLARAQSLRQAGRPEEAVAICSAILRDQPRHAGALELAGTVHAELGDLATARSYFERAVSANAGNATAHARLAQVLCDLREYDRAEASARRALALEARHAEAHNVLGNVLAARGAWDEAIVHYREAIAADPQCAIFYHNLGYALQNIGDEGAEAAYRKAVAVAPEFAPAYVNLGGLLLKQDNYEEARNLLQRAVALDPGDVDACNNLGLANRRLGRLSEAFSAYRAGLEKIRTQPVFGTTSGCSMKRRTGLAKPRLVSNAPLSSTRNSWRRNAIGCACYTAGVTSTRRMPGQPRFGSAWSARLPPQ